MMNMNPVPYRSLFAGTLSQSHQDQNVVVSGWVHKKRDHGSLLFIDLRDAQGLLQCVVQEGDEAFSFLDTVSLESVVRLEGVVKMRQAETINAALPTGEIELCVKKASLLSHAEPLPLSVNSEEDFPEETRLKYRFLDLRRYEMQRNIRLRSKVIQHLRTLMQQKDFLEIQTPILTASSPEGARDFLVPSRLHPGKFYALPQAPQQYKQLLMASGFDRYFQIAPCFRDEDARKDRSPGEFYQLDFEMAFVTQEEVFQTIEPVLYETFLKFAPQGTEISKPPFIRIPYHEALLHYGSDKPDLRNPLRLYDGGDLFEGTGFDVFLSALKTGSVIRALPVKGVAQQSRKFFDDVAAEMACQGAKGLAYLLVKEDGLKGPLAKFFGEKERVRLFEALNLTTGDGVFFVCDKPAKAARLGGFLRDFLGEKLNLVQQEAFQFCWVVDFPMYEKDPITDQIIFSHNPFSMPQGGLHALETEDPLSIKAYQYDIVVNGIELSSGAIRNHLPEVMLKAFAIAGHEASFVEEKFGALFNAFHFGVPPHGGAAPGIDRIVMLLAGAQNLRDITPFPLNQKAEDLLMGSPATAPVKHLEELSLKIQHKPPVHVARNKL